jgi:hypothetical protein
MRNNKVGLQFVQKSGKYKLFVYPGTGTLLQVVALIVLTSATTGYYLFLPLSMSLQRRGRAGRWMKR